MREDQATMQKYQSIRMFHNTLICHIYLVTPARFERTTYRLGICRSILLSYGAGHALLIKGDNDRPAIFWLGV